jgi:hypothetical protein
MTPSRDELIGIIGDVLTRGLCPERALIALRRRVNGVDADDLHLAMLMLLTEQHELIACSEREAVIRTRQIDPLENEIDDLNDELEALRASFKNLSYSHDDPEAA